MLVRGKGHGAPKMAWVPLHPSFASVWGRYLRLRERLIARERRRSPGLRIPSEALIHLWRGELTTYTDSGLDRIVQRLGQATFGPEAGRRLASHMLRRSGATLLEEVLLRGRSPTLDGVYRSVQAFLRHEDLTTTMRYLQGNPARQRQALLDYGRALPWSGERRPVSEYG